MQVRDIMTRNPASCSPATPLGEVAKMMVDHDCGSIPVLEKKQDFDSLLGIVTDRDIVCRTVAKNKNPLELTAHDCMSDPVVSIRETDSLETCFEIMDRFQIRRILVVDERGSCVGIVTQAHIARHFPEDKVGQLLRDVSRKVPTASRVPETVGSAVSLHR